MMYFVIVLIILWLGYWFMKRFRRRWLRWLVLVPGLTAVFFAVGWQSAIAEATRPDPAMQLETQIIETYSVALGDLVVVVSGTGSVIPARQIPLVFQTSAPVKLVLFDEGDSVSEGDVVATLDTIDLDLLLADAEIALTLQQTILASLTAPAREVDLLAAESALQAARAQSNAAFATGPTANDREIARLQAELSRNRLWQTQMQRDMLQAGTSFPLIPSVDTTVDIPDSVIQAIDTNFGVTIPNTIDLNAPGADEFIGQVNAFISATNAQSSLAVRGQRQQLEDALVQLEYGVQISDVNYQSALNRSGDFGALQSARLQTIQAEIALERLRDGPGPIALERATIEIELAELAMDQVRYNQSQGQLVAPFGGVIAQNNLSIGQLPPQGPAVILMDVAELYVELPIDETDIVRVAVGQRVEFEVDALPGVIVTGTVVRTAYTPVIIGQLVTYPVRVRLDRGTEAIRVGMSVTAQIITSERSDVVVAPNRFIRVDRETGRAYVIVREIDGSLREIAILLGERSATVSEVTSGLVPGQELVLLPRGLAETLNGGA